MIIVFVFGSERLVLILFLHDNVSLIVCRSLTSIHSQSLGRRSLVHTDTIFVSWQIISITHHSEVRSHRHKKCWYLALSHSEGKESLTAGGDDVLMMMMMMMMMYSLLDTRHKRDKISQLLWLSL